MDDSKKLSIFKDWSDALRLQGGGSLNWRIMKLNNTKRKLMHYGKQNLMFEYLVKDDDGSIGFLEKSRSEKDLGIIFSNNLNYLSWRTLLFIVQKGEHDLGMLKNTFASRDIKLWNQLCVSMVRPHLEYAFQVWSSFREADTKKLEEVQRRAT